MAAVKIVLPDADLESAWCRLFRALHVCVSVHTCIPGNSVHY